MNRNEIDKLLPKRVIGVDLYDPKRIDIKYDLSDNTSQWPMAANVQMVLSSVISSRSISKYPEIYADSLKESIVSSLKRTDSLITIDNIVIGNGTDDVLDCIVRALTDESDTIIVPSPSFPMVQYFGKYNGRKVVNVDLQTDGSIDLEDICSSNSQLLYLCSPNNPTGQLIPEDNLINIANKYEGFIIIDEAYVEYSKQNILYLLNNYPKIIIVRTFSKLYSLAGLRIGYCIATSQIAKAIEVIRGPYKANIVGIAGAIESLNNRSYYNKVIKETIRVREWFIKELQKIGFEPIDSEANFVFIPFDEASEVFESIKTDCEQQNISLRFFYGEKVDIKGIRITLTTQDVLEKVIAILLGYAK